MNLRWHAYGYRSTDGVVQPFDAPSSCAITYHRDYANACLRNRSPMMISLGPIVLGAAQPHPDIRCPRTMADGCLKRIAAKLPCPKKQLLKELKVYVRKWCRKRLVPLSPDTDLSFETWIASKKYPESRKAELKLVHETMVKGTLTEKMRRVKAFMKDETYGEYKHGRGIFSRVDAFKCIFGPLCSAIEEQVYQQPEFIKHIPVADRPSYIEEFLASSARDVCATDYTSFESSFSKELMQSLDQILFDYMTQHLKNSFVTEVYRSLMRDNVCQFKFFTLVIEARRMSGEMNTSLSNGFANLMVMSYLVEKLGLGEMRMVVEGDDGLCITSSGRFPQSTDFADLGFKIKIEKHKMKERASFCGIIYHPDDKKTITDPRKVLVKFGWASSAYVGCRQKKLIGLLRCKSLSNLHQYPGCPIIQKLSLYGLRMTKSFDVRGFVMSDRRIDQFERERILAALDDITTDDIRNWEQNNPIGSSSRALVEEMYGITIEQQLAVEKYLDEKTDLEPLNLTEVVDFDKSWSDYYCKYVFPTDGKNIDLMAMSPDPRAVEFESVRIKVRS